MSHFLTSRESQVVDYSLEFSPFVENFSQFSIRLLPDGQLGLGPLHPRAVIATSVVADPFFVPQVNHQPVSGTSASLPEAVEQSGEVDCVELTLSFAFADPRILVGRLTAHNKGTAPADLSATGFAFRDRPSGMLSAFPGTSKVLRDLEITSGQDPLSVTLTLASLATDLPGLSFLWQSANPEWEFVASPDPGGKGQGLLWRRLNPLAPGESESLDFTLTLSHKNRPFAQTDLGFEQAKDQARSRIHAVTKGLPPHDGRIKARLALLRDSMKGVGTDLGPAIASLCTSDASDFSCTFFWDSLFSARALTRFHPAAAKGAIQAVFSQQHPRDGASPERGWLSSVPQKMLQHNPQPPIATQAVLDILNFTGETSFAEQMLPKLRANHSFWEHHSDGDRDGLAEFRWSGQAGDNLPLWDDYGSGLTGFGGCIWLPPVASVHLNCFLMQDALHLSQLCEKLGLIHEANEWRQRRLRIQESLQQWCWDEETEWFWDYNHQTTRHTKIKTIFMFWPLWAGVPLPEKRIDEVIDGLLLNPECFLGDIPFPTVSTDEPTYDGNGYWRGRAWPHLSFWMLELLWKYGRHAEANQIADRLLDIWESFPGFPENISTISEQPGPPGYLNYNWGIAAYLLTAERAYQQVDSSARLQ